MQDILHCLKQQIFEHRQEDCYKMKKIMEIISEFNPVEPAVVQDGMKWRGNFLFGMELTDLWQQH